MSSVPHKIGLNPLILKRYIVTLCIIFMNVSFARCPINTDQPGHWENLSGADCALAQKILYWKSLEDRTDVTFEEITDFFLKNPSWPNQVALKRKAENAITATTSPQKMRVWFLKNPPVTAKGAIAFVNHVIKLGQTHESKLISQFFPKITFSKKELKTFMERAHPYIKNTDLINRFDACMKNDQVDAADMMLSYLPKGYVDIARDRIKLAKGQYTQRRQTTMPGYLWQYALYLLKANKDEELLNFLTERATSKSETMDPALWWTSIRRILLRRFLEDQHYTKAYQIALHAKVTNGAEVAEAKWLKGWIRLRFLKQSKEAFNDFKEMYERSDTALHFSKAAYFAARAASAIKSKALERDWLEKASKHRASFYGQIAHDMLGKSFKPKDMVVSEAERKAFEKLELVRVIRLLKKVGNIELSELFFWKIAMNIIRPDEHELLIKLAADVAGPYAAVQVTKIGAKHMMPDIEESYPQIASDDMPPLSPHESVNIHALIHAIIRQESRFNTRVTSPKGAKGLMQILDGTAKLVAKASGGKAGNLYDPKTNIALGEGYLKQLLQRYNGSLILTLSAYNAGPGRADKWAQKFGSPGDKSGFEAVEWISMIPFKETRHYVERVLENYWRYVVAFDGVPIENWHKVLF